MKDNTRGEASASSFFIKKIFSKVPKGGLTGEKRTHIPWAYTKKSARREVADMAAAWTARKDEIKAKYITSKRKPTFRELAREFGGNKDTIRRWAVDEHWDIQRERHEEKIETKVLQNDIQAKTSRAKKIAEAADLLLDGIITGIGVGRPVTPTAAKNYSDALKNIKDIHMIRSAEDIEEQKARIAKLNREAEKEDNRASVTVIIEGEMEYAE